MLCTETIFSCHLAALCMLRWSPAPHVLPEPNEGQYLQLPVLPSQDVNSWMQSMQILIMHSTLGFQSGSLMPKGMFSVILNGQQIRPSVLCSALLAQASLPSVSAWVILSCYVLGERGSAHLDCCPLDQLLSVRPDKATSPFEMLRESPTAEWDCSRPQQ